MGYSWSYVFQRPRREVPLMAPRAQRDARGVREDSLTNRLRSLTRARQKKRHAPVLEPVHFCFLSRGTSNDPLNMTSVVSVVEVGRVSEPRRRWRFHRPAPVTQSSETDPRPIDASVARGRLCQGRRYWRRAEGRSLYPMRNPHRSNAQCTLFRHVRYS